MTLSDEELMKRDAQRNIGGELLEAVREIKPAGWAGSGQCQFPLPLKPGVILI
jgi:hypothetical protein